MSWLTDLFGGSNATQQSTSTPVDLNPFTALRPQLQNTLSGLLTSGVPAYSGPMNAPIGANEQSVLTQLMGQTAPGNARQSYLDSVLAGNYLPGGSQQNPFLQASIEAAQRPTQQALEETLSRTLPGRFTQAGQFTNPQGSSAFDRAAAIATRGAAQALGDIATNISSNAYTSERTNQQQAVPLSQAEVDTSIKNLQAQALPRMIQELGIERGLTEFQNRTQSLLQLLQVIGGVTAPNIANQYQSTGESTMSKGVIPALFPNGLFGGAKTTGGGSSG